jgi:hypothetical protein
MEIRGKVGFVGDVVCRGTRIFAASPRQAMKTFVQ